MRQRLIKSALFVMACLAMILGALGIILPLLPATPFFILALFGFSRSSSRFKHWLLSLPVIGQDLTCWQMDKKIDKKRKPIIYISIIISFLVSILLLIGLVYLQLMLIALMLILLFFIRKLPEY
ncbi:YbaN family protein [Psychromonas algicola]|uniref:YbaN family protein n=1 Tax=Psychromonas algicola TaxID=2555642 RepID=UPI00106783DB|nr:YbaN family protein [Psychromonas sp. RZ5]TEW52086.1 DUF454 domain-containing protein [Psychromonas sp. RZ5]